LTEHTVRNYLIRIFDKLGISSRVKLVLYAFSGTEGNATPEHPKTLCASAAPPPLSFPDWFFVTMFDRRQVQAVVSLPPKKRRTFARAARILEGIIKRDNLVCDAKTQVLNFSALG
jgi:hypothetical protein